MIKKSSVLKGHLLQMMPSCKFVFFSFLAHLRTLIRYAYQIRVNVVCLFFPKCCRVIS